MTQRSAHRGIRYARMRGPLDTRLVSHTYVGSPPTNVLTDSTVSNGFPHGGVILYPHLHNQADKIYHPTILGYRAACFSRERQVREHKTGSPVHIVTFGVARVFLSPDIVLPHSPRNRQWPCSSVMKHSDTAIYAHGVMDKLKSLPNQGKTTLVRRSHGLSSKTVKGKRHLPNRGIKLLDGTSRKQSNHHTIITSSWVSTRKVMHRGLISLTVRYYSQVLFFIFPLSKPVTLSGGRYAALVIGYKGRPGNTQSTLKFKGLLN
jgi:hypothetical protein